VASTEVTAVSALFHLPDRTLPPLADVAAVICNDFAATNNPGRKPMSVCRRSLVRNILATLALSALAATPIARATTVNKADADCSGLELKAAAGVPDGAVH
jgi:hypothetical protein